MESTIESATAQSTPPHQVDQLIQMVADEAGLSIVGEIDEAGSVDPKLNVSMPSREVNHRKEDALEARLAALRK